MPEILTLSRSEVEKVRETAPHAFIVIHDPDLPQPTVNTNVSTIGYFFMAFDDISYESEFDQTFSEEQAVEVSRFIKTHVKTVKKFFVSCEAGRSRSVGLAAALEEWLTGEKSRFFYDSEKEPNSLVHKKMKRALVI